MSDCRQTADALALGKQVVEYCADCGDVAPGVPYIAEGPLRDPANTFVRTTPDRFERLCGSDTLRVSEETATGILIVPETIGTAAPAPDYDAALGFGCGISLAVAAFALRRRRAMRPRAIHLG